MGMPHENITLCDTKGVIYQGRDRGHEPVEVAHAIKTEDRRTLEEAWTARTCSSACR
jgi:malate dehydrogenase (oxaloacetate-decarboxylating)(NADP+)